MKGYEKLDDVLARAFKQASEGKGKERHANDLPFHEQPMQQVNRMVGVGFSHGQAIKKIVESQNMEPEKAVHELLGAICYIAGGIITIESRSEAPVFETLADVAKAMQRKYEYLDPKTWELHSVFDYQPIGGDWIAIPEGADICASHPCAGNTFYRFNGSRLDYFTRDNHWSETNYSSDNYISEMDHNNYLIVWSRDISLQPAKLNRDQAREILANMKRGSVANINGEMVSFDQAGIFRTYQKGEMFDVQYNTDSVYKMLNELFGEEI